MSKAGLRGFVYERERTSERELKQPPKLDPTRTRGDQYRIKISLEQLGQLVSQFEQLEPDNERVRGGQRTARENRPRRELRFTIQNR